MEIKFIKREKLKEKPLGNLGFGKYQTDYLLYRDYKDGKWEDPIIAPFENFSYNPSMYVLHYAQETFEGMKAYRTNEGKVLLFRPLENAKRFMRSNERMCMPVIPAEEFLICVESLVKIEKNWIPSEKNSSLYIRPFMYATDIGLGVKASKTYRFVIICSPSSEYYKFEPSRIYVEDYYVRAVKGGTGEAKCGGNYAASIIAAENAQKKGFSQVLWLDGVERKYVEEVGTMNVMFKIAGKIVTAPLDGSILPGITRDSCLKILKSFGYEIEERKLSIQELMEASKKGILEEAWGTGTAAVITPIGELYYQGFTMKINNFEVGEVTKKLFEHLKSIQFGEFKYLDWSYEVK